MAAGRPVICLDLGGPGVQVTPKTGIKVPAYHPDQAITDLAKAMSRLAGDWKLRFQLGKAGKEQVKEFYNWNNKGKKLASLYENLVKTTKNSILD